MSSHRKVYIANLGVYSSITVGQPCGQLTSQSDNPKGQEYTVPTHPSGNSFAVLRARWRRTSRQCGFPELARQRTETKARVKYSFVCARNVREAGLIGQSSEREKATRRRRSSSRTQTTPLTIAGQQGKSGRGVRRRKGTRGTQKNNGSDETGKHKEKRQAFVRKSK